MFSIDLKTNITKVASTAITENILLPSFYEYALMSSAVAEDLSKSATIKNAELALLEASGWKIQEFVCDAELDASYLMPGPKYALPIGYAGAMFIHQKRGQIVIAHRGSNIYNWKAVMDDFERRAREKTPDPTAKATAATKPLATDYLTDITYDLFAIKSLPDTRYSAFRLLDQLFSVSIPPGPAILNSAYCVSFTGHALGATLAELCLFLLEMEKLPPQRICAGVVTFESPGSIELIRDTLAGHSSVEHKDFTKSNCISFLSEPSIMNTYNHHPGTAHRIKFPISAESSLSRLKASHSMRNMLAMFDPATGNPCAGLCYSWQSEGPITAGFNPLAKLFPIDSSRYNGFGLDCLKIIGDIIADRYFAQHLQLKNYYPQFALLVQTATFEPLRIERYLEFKLSELQERINVDFPFSAYSTSKTLIGIQHFPLALQGFVEYYLLPRPSLYAIAAYSSIYYQAFLKEYHLDLSDYEINIISPSPLSTHKSSPMLLAHHSSKKSVVEFRDYLIQLSTHYNYGLLCHSKLYQKDYIYFLKEKICEANRQFLYLNTHIENLNDQIYYERDIDKATQMRAELAKLYTKLNSIAQDLNNFKFHLIHGLYGELKELGMLDMLNLLLKPKEIEAAESLFKSITESRPFASVSKTHTDEASPAAGAGR